MEGPLVRHLTDWKQCPVLNVESNRLPIWHRPGLLLIGDAAHVMSPVGGIGINYAIQDAIETANQLTGKLKAGTVTDADLAGVQQRPREWPTKVIQGVQKTIQNQIVAAGLKETNFRLPLAARVLAGMPDLGLGPALDAWVGRAAVCENGVKYIAAHQQRITDYTVADSPAGQMAFSSAKEFRGAAGGDYLKRYNQLLKLTEAAFRASEV